jgi:hypothetical protein
MRNTSYLAGFFLEPAGSLALWPAGFRFGLPLGSSPGFVSQ